MGKSTDELLNVLNGINDTSKLDSYIINMKNTESYPNVGMYFEDLLEEKKLKKSEVILTSQLDRTYAYQIFNGTRIGSRNKLLSLCIAMKLSLEETNRILTLNGDSILYAKNIRDAIIIYCINQQYSLYETNILLEERNAGIINE